MSRIGTEPKPGPSSPGTWAGMSPGSGLEAKPVLHIRLHLTTLNILAPANIPGAFSHFLPLPWRR